MKNYDEKQEDNYIMYLNANNLYGHSMSQKLPTGNFKWVENVNDEFVKSYNSKGNKGCFVECDLDYPQIYIINIITTLRHQKKEAI